MLLNKLFFILFFNYIFNASWTVCKRAYIQILIHHSNGDQVPAYESKQKKIVKCVKIAQRTQFCLKADRLFCFRAEKSWFGQANGIEAVEAAEAEQDFRDVELDID